MGRWSAAHWKTATFGWLAFVVVAFALGGLVGTKTIDTDKPGPGESGRMDRILDAGFEQPAGELVLVQSRSLTADDPAFDGRDRGRRRARLGARRSSQNVRSPLAPGNAGQIAQDGRSALVELDIRGDAGRRGRRDRARPRRGRRRAGRPSRLLHRRVRRRERAARRSRPPTATTSARPASLSLPITLAHPRGRVRSARRGRDPAAARADRGVRDVRAARAAQQPCCRWRSRPTRWCS